MTITLAPTAQLLQGRFPNLDRWFEAMESRPAYLGFKSDYYTHCHDLPPQLGGESAPQGTGLALYVAPACRNRR